MDTTPEALENVHLRWGPNPTAQLHRAALTDHPMLMGGSVVVLAKSPEPGSCKTRLIPSLGAEGAAQLARAMLGDVLTTLACCKYLDGVDKILMYAPPDEKGRATMESILEQYTMTQAWTLLPVPSIDTAGSSLKNPQILGRMLTHALVQACRRQYDQAPLPCGGGQVKTGPVLFLGMDSPELPMEEVVAGCSVPATAVEARSDYHQDHDRALLCPAADGGYGLLSLPASISRQVQLRLLPPEGGHHLEAAEEYAARYFARIPWSTSCTGWAQLKALTDCHVPVQVGRLMYDIDEPDDVQALCQRLMDVFEFEADGQVHYRNPYQKDYDTNILCLPSVWPTKVGVDEPSGGEGGEETHFVYRQIITGSCWHTRQALVELGLLTSQYVGTIHPTPYYQLAPSDRTSL